MFFLLAVIIGAVIGTPAARAEPLSATQQADILLDMAMLDRAYIPALAYTSQGKLDASRLAMRRLQGTWATLAQRYQAFSSADPQWRADFADVDAMILRAAAIVTDGRQLVDAHETLEGVRVRLRELRLRSDMDYFVDYLTAFHEPMEHIVLALKDKAPDAVTDTLLVELRSVALPHAKQLWVAVESARLDSRLFGFSDAKVAEAKTLIHEEGLALAELEGALVQGDRASIIQRGVAIKPSFAKLFMAFGDFDY